MEWRKINLKKIIGKLSIFTIMIFFPLGASCGLLNQNPKTERHAFLLNNSVFIADVPTNWRFLLEPVDDYYYYRDLAYCDEQRSVYFMGVGEKEGEEDNFFSFSVVEGDWNIDEYDYDRIPFTFRDGTLGEWASCIVETEPQHGDWGVLPFYYGTVYDLGKKYGIGCLMLKEEYDTNEQVIKDFLESTCFRESDLGIDGGEDISEREWLTLHIWNKSIRMSLKVPEGLKIKVEDDRCYIYLDENNTLGIYPDYEGETLERTGDYYYYLNVEDFEETVYEIPNKYSGHNYYFPSQYLMIWNVDKNDEKLQEYAKKIVQSMRFD